MLSLLLAAAVHQPELLCPPCHPEAEDATFFGFIISLFKSAVSLLVVFYPLYKTFKAWESNRLRACRAMLAYWSAMTLLNTLKDVTDEIVGGYINNTLHHLIVAGLKLAPLVLGPDKIYDMTVRPFFESHEEQLDIFVKEAHEQMGAVKNNLMEKAGPMLDNVQKTVTPMIDNLKEVASPLIKDATDTVMDAVHSAQAHLGIASTRDELDLEKEKAQREMRELTPSEAAAKDAALTPIIDPTAATGLKQRRNIAAAAKSSQSSSSSSSSSSQPAPASSTAEIEQARANAVLVEKIVWGHALTAKNDEYERQKKEKELIENNLNEEMSKAESPFNLNNLSTTPTNLPPLPPLPVEDKQRLLNTENNNLNINNTASTTTTTIKSSTLTPPPSTIPSSSNNSMTSAKMTTSRVNIDGNGYNSENRKEL